jgi:hypothetical protein
LLVLWAISIVFCSNLLFYVYGHVLAGNCDLCFGYLLSFANLHSLFANPFSHIVPTLITPHILLSAHSSSCNYHTQGRQQIVLSFGISYVTNIVTYQNFGCSPMYEFSQKFKTFCLNMWATQFYPKLLASHPKFSIK